MKVERFIFLYLTWTLVATTVHAQLDVKEITLNNGMTVWLNEDHSQPKVYGAVVVKAGAVDCPDTGIAHYFEHMMFKGTDELGTIDYAAEKVWLDSIETQYELLSQTPDPEERNRIQQTINRLSRQAAQYAIPNEFNRLISKYGGSELNAGTTYDYTYYHNVFSPQFIHQWAELNSHRLLHPVFRLFQGELETVYEEKNRSADNPLMSALEHGIREFCKGTPYEYPIIGSTENLKNPRFSEMKKFYETYYVASNMGLILVGDICADTLQPLLEKTFGKVPRGSVPQRQETHMAPLHGNKTAALKVPIPLIKASILAFRAPTDFEQDAPALDIACHLLSNENKTGLLDSLTLSFKIEEALAMRTALNGIGFLAVATIPNIPFGSKEKAEALCWKEIDRLKRGEFDDRTLGTMIMEVEKQNALQLEDIDSRAEIMVNVFAQGKSWDSYLEQQASTRHLTKTDITRVANQYFSQNHIRFIKKYGTYPKDVVSKPDFEPIAVQHSDARSFFAKKLDEIPLQKSSPRLLDFYKDATRHQLDGQNDLYWKENPLNDFFKFSVMINKGYRNDRRLDALATYLSQVGTDSLSRQELNKAFLRLGASMEIKAEANHFILEINGRDDFLQPTLRLLHHFMHHVQTDKKAMKSLISDTKVEEKSFGKDNQEVFYAMLGKIVYGDLSKQRQRLSVKELKALKEQELKDLFLSLNNQSCTFVYSGKTGIEQVEEIIRKELGISSRTQHDEAVFRKPQLDNERVVYFFDMPKSRQTLVGSCQNVNDILTDREQVEFDLFAQYFGGGMSSVMFQEIRECRSLAYSTSAFSVSNPPEMRMQPAVFVTITGTQADKTEQAATLLDSLLHNLPENHENFEAAKQEMLNNANNGFPDFRHVGCEIAEQRRTGYQEDKHAAVVREVESFQFSEFANFHHKHISHSPRALIVVGSKKSTDLHFLARFGRVVELKKKDIFNE